MLYLLWWINWGLAGYVWLIVFRLIENKGKFPEADVAGYLRGFLLSIVLGPLCFAFLVYLILRKLMRKGIHD